MAQASWTYPDENGRHHSVGLYHGDRSGHFLLYCNGSIVTIDFKVFEEKKYSFLIEDELCEIFLKKKPDGTFEYDFKVNEDIETPRNIQRKERNVSDRKKALWFWSGFVALVFGFSFGMISYLGEQRKKEFFGESSHFVGKKYDAKTLKVRGGQTEVKIELGPIQEGKNEVRYAFTTFQKTNVRGVFEAEAKNGELWLPTGFPLSEDDRFLVTYSHEKPQNHHAIEFRRPMGNTLIRYFGLVLDDEQKYHADEPPEKIVCRLQTILETRGLEGIALLLHRETEEAQNEAFNKTKAANMLNDPILKRTIIEKCPTSKDSTTIQQNQ